MSRCKKTDALVGAVKKAGGGGIRTSADTARSLAREMGGMVGKYAAGGAGKVRKGCAPIKKAKGGPVVRIDLDKAKAATAKRDAADKARYRKAMGSDADILARGERNQAREAKEADMLLGKKPVKRARGGAGKVRKGMMTQSGDVKRAVHPKKGIGGYM